MSLPFPIESVIDPHGRLNKAWQRFFQSINGNSLGGTVTNVSVVPANGVSGTVANPSTTPAITIALGAITPTSVAATGNLSGANLNLAAKLTTSGAFASTFTMTGVTSVTFPTSGTLATLSGTEALSNKTITSSSFSGTTVAGTVITATTSIGYATGAGGTVTQLTSKSTGVTLNKITGQITMNNATLAGNTVVTFPFTNSTIGATDMVYTQIVGGEATPGTYIAYASEITAGSANINVYKVGSGSLSEAIVIGFAVIKSVTA